MSRHVGDIETTISVTELMQRSADAPCGYPEGTVDMRETEKFRQQQTKIDLHRQTDTPMDSWIKPTDDRSTDKLIVLSKNIKRRLCYSELTCCLPSLSR